jgi:hypothetical protein
MAKRRSCRPSCSAIRSPGADAPHAQRHAAGDVVRLRAHGARQGPARTRGGAQACLRNALTPVITLGALEFGTLLSGAVLTEQIFSIPGFGKLIVDAVFNRDYAVVQGVVLVTATTYMLLNLLADIGYILVNPRLRTDRMSAPAATLQEPAVESPAQARVAAAQEAQERDARSLVILALHDHRAVRAVDRALRSGAAELERGAQGAVGGALVRHGRGGPRHSRACHLRGARLTDGGGDLGGARDFTRRAARPDGGLCRRLARPDHRRVTDAMLACRSSSWRSRWRPSSGRASPTR